MIYQLLTENSLRELPENKLREPIMNEFLPSDFHLGQNYPNPFRERTIIKYCIPYKTKVQMKIYNTEGRLIRTLVDEEKDPGTYEVEFHPCDREGLLKEGCYYYCLVAGNYSNEKEMILGNEIP